MTVNYWLTTATKFLESRGIATARLDALVLLEDTLRVDRAKLLAEPDMEITAGAVAALQKLLSRRATHEPLAYIRERAEFYGRTFIVSPAVLVPRPESETMIALLKALPDLPAKPRIADIGSGSGCLGITAALELSEVTVELLEIDAEALKISQANVVLHTTDTAVIHSDLLAQTAHQYDVLLCNLPYVPDDYPINAAAGYEPAIALYSGVDGLDLFRELFNQLQTQTSKPLYILCEAFPNQQQAIAEFAAPLGYQITQIDDFILVLRLAN